MQRVFVIITKLIASKNYFCKEVFCNNFGRDGSDVDAATCGNKTNIHLSKTPNF